MSISEDNSENDVQLNVSTRAILKKDEFKEQIHLFDDLMLEKNFLENSYMFQK